jgi:hypothetical protein
MLPKAFLPILLLLTACNKTVVGVPDSIWEGSLFYVDAMNDLSLRPVVSCDGGLIYDLTSTDLHLTGTVSSGHLFYSPPGIFRRGAPYALEVSCLDGNGREIGYSRIGGSVPVNGVIHKPWNEGEALFQITVQLRSDPTKTPSAAQQCLGSMQGTGAPCIYVEY